MEVNIEGLDKAAVLIALYNASKVMGMGVLHARKSPFTVGEATKLLKEYSRFDYLFGRIMKVDLAGNSFDPDSYDRDNGAGAAQRAIDKLRAAQPQ